MWPQGHAPPPLPPRVPDTMDPPTSAAVAQASRDEELRGECAKAFEHYKRGNLTRGTELLEKLLTRHPAHPLLHFAYARLAHLRALEQRQLAGVKKQFEECGNRAEAAIKACPASLLPRLLYAQAFYDFPTLNDQVLDVVLDTVRAVAADGAARPLDTTDLVYARAIATFDEEVPTLPLLPDVRECADSAAYQSQAVSNLTKASALISDLHREVGNLVRRNPGQSGLDHFIDMRDAEHVAEAARRLQRVQASAVEEEADLALAAVHRLMVGGGAAHNLQEAAAGWRESTDQGDASARLIIGAIYGRCGGGVKMTLRHVQF